MQQVILEEHLHIIVSESEGGGEIDDAMHLERDEFFEIMLRKHSSCLYE